MRAERRELELLADRAAGFEQFQQLRAGGGWAGGAQDEDVPLADDGGHAARRPRRKPAHHGAAFRAVAICPADRRRLRGGAGVDGDAAFLGKFYGLCVEHLGSGLGHFLRLFVAQGIELPRRRDHAGIGGINAVHVAADLAPFRAQRGRERHGGRVAAAATQGRDFLFVGNALVTGDDDDFPPGQLVLHPEGADLDDAGVRVPVVRDDAALAAGEGDRLAAEFPDGDAEQRHGDAFAGGEEHVQLAARRVGESFFARPSRSSVVSPIAETTTQTA